MLTIRKEQMDKFARVRTEDFERKLVAHLKELVRQGAITVDESRIEEQVRRGVASGMRFFRTEKDLARYCEIVLTKLGGWHGQDHPEAALRMLRSGSIEAERRLDNFGRWIVVKEKGR